MKTKDDLRWADQELELQADETSQKFLSFFLAWMENAETHLCDGRTPIEAVRYALTCTERDLGFLSTEWIGQMLLLAFAHWIHGEDMASGMTVIEERVLAQMSAVKMVDLQEQAAKL